MFRLPKPPSSEIVVRKCGIMLSFFSSRPPVEFIFPMLSETVDFTQRRFICQARDIQLIREP